MSIQTELTRLTNAKAAIKTAIEGKGVTVPEATLLDGMASLIESLEAGGGCKVTSGTIVPATDAGISITHDLGEAPNVFFWFTTDFTNHNAYNTTNTAYYSQVVSNSNGDTFCGGYFNGVSFVMPTNNPQSSVHMYMVYFNNVDHYSRKVYNLSSTTIRSDTSALACGMTGETVRWIAAII